MVGIKGMEMPRNCFQCRFMYHRDWCYANPDIIFDDADYSELKGRYPGCPLVEIKEDGEGGRRMSECCMTREEIAKMEENNKFFYELGLNEAWEAAKKIAGDCLCESRMTKELFDFNYAYPVFKNISASEAVEKLHTYEEQKKQDEIKIGDEVVYCNDSKVKFIVTMVKDGYIFGFNTTGEFSNKNASCWVKTGRTFPEIAEVLKKMQEGE